MATLAALVFSAATALAWGASQHSFHPYSEWHGRGWYVVEVTPNRWPHFFAGPYRSREVCQTAALNLTQPEEDCIFLAGHEFLGAIPGSQSPGPPVIVTRRRIYTTIGPPHEIH
jgi:hypothetical protein